MRAHELRADRDASSRVLRLGWKSDCDCRCHGNDRNKSRFANRNDLPEAHLSPKLPNATLNPGAAMELDPFFYCRSRQYLSQVIRFSGETLWKNQSTA
jgi:hypothetical protein